MRRLTVVAMLLMLSGCGLTVRHAQVDEAPAGGYQTQHHQVVVTYDTEPACAGSCSPGVKGW